MRYTAAIMGHTTYEYTTVVVEKNALAVAKTMVAAAVAASLSITILIPSCSTYPLSFLGAGHMPENPCLYD